MWFPLMGHHPHYMAFSGLQPGFWSCPKGSWVGSTKQGSHATHERLQVHLAVWCSLWLSSFHLVSLRFWGQQKVLVNCWVILDLLPFFTIQVVPVAKFGYIDQFAKRRDHRTCIIGFVQRHHVTVIAVISGVSLYEFEQAKTCQDSRSDHPDRISWDLFNGTKKHSESETIRSLIRVIPNHLAPLPGFRSKYRLKVKLGLIRSDMWCLYWLFQRLIALWDMGWKAMLNTLRI